MIDWEFDKRKLYNNSVTAIEEFSKEYPSEIIQYFAFDADPHAGYISISLDSPESSKQTVLQLEKYAAAKRLNMLLNPKIGWRNAKYYLNYPPLSVFNTNPGDFAYQNIRISKFPKWKDLSESNEYEKGQEHEDDYIDGNVRILIWKVVEELIENKIFNCLNVTSPFLIGYSIHDQEECILRILNYK